MLTQGRVQKYLNEQQIRIAVAISMLTKIAVEGVLLYHMYLYIV